MDRNILLQHPPSQNAQWMRLEIARPKQMVLLKTQRCLLRISAGQLHGPLNEALLFCSFKLRKLYPEGRDVAVFVVLSLAIVVIKHCERDMPDWRFTFGTRWEKLLAKHAGNPLRRVSERSTTERAENNRIAP